MEKLTKTNTGKERPAEVAGLEPAAVQAGLQDGSGESWSPDKNWSSRKAPPNSRWEGQEGTDKRAWQGEREFEGNEKITAQELNNMWNRIRPVRRTTVLQEAERCDVDGCGNQHVQFKTAQLLFEVVHDAEGARTRAVCFDCLEKSDKATGKEASPGTFKVRAGAKKASADGRTQRWTQKEMRTDLLVSSCTTHGRKTRTKELRLG